MAQNDAHRAFIGVALAFTSGALLMAPWMLAAEQGSATRSAGGAAVAPDAGKPPIDQALQLAHNAREKFRTIQDYTCTFIKQERINGQLQSREFIQMKARPRPLSIYMKWLRPYDGREVIYVQGQNNGRLLAHSVGVEKVVGGTVELDPRGDRAMENSRHSITEAGIGNLVEQLIARWEAEKKLGQTKVELRDNATVDKRVCWLVKTTHPNDPRHYAYYRTRVLFDKENGLPIHFEGYDWPRRNSSPDGDLVEVYTCRDLRFNIPLSSADFSIDNPSYNFGRL